MKSGADLGEFLDLSRWAGERFDLVQAAGGNSSVKPGAGHMIIKASGVALGEMAPAHGHAEVMLPPLREFLAEAGRGPQDRDHHEREGAAVLRGATGPGGGRPSMETWMHVLLKRHVLHVHPLAVTAVCCRDDWREVLTALFPEASFISYRTPGLRLALAIAEGLRSGPPTSGTYFLQNHGLLVTDDDPMIVRNMTEAVERRLENWLGADYSGYRSVSSLHAALQGLYSDPFVVHRSRDSFLEHVRENRPELFFRLPLFPDQLVYNGFMALDLRGGGDLEEKAHEHRARFGELPRVVVDSRSVYFVAASIRKARDMEEVERMHIHVLLAAGASACPLPEPELHRLSQWEVEKYRREKRD